MRPAALVLTLLLALLPAGCAGAQDGADEAAGDGSARNGRGPKALQGPETLYLYFTGQGHLRPEPDNRPADGAGLFLGGACYPGPRTPCWNATFSGNAQAAHAGGDEVRVWMWLHGLKGLEPVTLEAWLSSDGVPLGQGLSEPFSPSQGTRVPGPEGCAMAEVAFPLAADVAQGAALKLTLHVDGLTGGDCIGGGEDGSRLTIGL